jgi:hypothetical protein
VPPARIAVTSPDSIFFPAQHHPALPPATISVTWPGSTRVFPARPLRATHSKRAMRQPT